MKPNQIDLTGVEIPAVWHSHAPPRDGTLFIVRNPAWKMAYIARGREGQGYFYTGIALSIDGSPADTRHPDDIPCDPKKMEWGELVTHEPATSTIALYLTEGARA